jgi:hypothetical protein
VIPGYLVGCAGCGGLFMLDQPLARKAPAGYPLDLQHDPWFCRKCSTRRATTGATDA